MGEELTFENGLHISWVRGLDGGGSSQYIDFLTYLKQDTKHYTHCLEWCSGLGAIGYSILDAGICDKLSFNELYPPAEEYAIKNAIANNVQDKVKFYLGDSVNVIPTDQKFDLVVANPPHCYVPFEHSGILEDQDMLINTRLILDTDWNTHKNFFANIIAYLLPGADVILSETLISEEHIEFAETNGLKFIKSTPANVLMQKSTPSAVLMHYRYEA